MQGQLVFSVTDRCKDQCKDGLFSVPALFLCSYLPLEVMNGDLAQLHKADMFALGATMLQLATSTELPSGGHQYQDLRAGKLPLLPTCTQRFANMIRRACESCMGCVGLTLHAGSCWVMWHCIGGTRSLHCYC